MSFACSLYKNRDYLPIVPNQCWGPYWERNSTLCYSKSDTVLAATCENFISLEVYCCWSIECFGCESRCAQTFDSEGSALQAVEVSVRVVQSQLSRLGCLSPCSHSEHLKSTARCALSSQHERRLRQCILYLTQAPRWVQQTLGQKHHCSSCQSSIKTVFDLPFASKEGFAAWMSWWGFLPTVTQEKNLNVMASA